MDYQILSKTKDNRVDVLLVAVKRSVLESYLTGVEEAGLKPKVMDVDFFALENLFEATYPVAPTEAAALVDIGASSTKLVVVHGGIPVFTKEFRHWRKESDHGNSKTPQRLLYRR